MKIIKILLPNVDIANRFSTEVSAIFKRQDLLEQENFELAKLRDWLLPMLMNGQATVVDSESKKLAFPAVSQAKANHDPRFQRWLENQALAARGSIDEATLKDIFDAMDDDDK